MFTINDDNSIYLTRGDIVFFSVSAEDAGADYTFQAGDVVRIKVFGKKDAENVVLQKDFPVTENTESVEIFLDEHDTKIGEVISKPTDYWYEVELNPDTNPQTIIGYDEDGAKVFKLFPEGRDLTEFEPEIKPEDIPVVDKELNLASVRPVQNQAVAKAVLRLQREVDRNKADANDKANGISAKVESVTSAVNVERARIDNLISCANTTLSQPLEYLDFITEETRAKIDGTINSDGVFATISVNFREANQIYGGTEMDVFAIPAECRPVDVGIIHAGDGLEYRIKYDVATNRHYMSIAAQNGVTVAPSGAGTVAMTYMLGDYELFDIRVGANGKVYGNAGMAVREQLSDISAYIGSFATKPDNRVPIDFTKRTHYVSGATTSDVTATETQLTVVTNNVNADVEVGFDTVVGRRYSVSVDVSGLTSTLRFFRIQKSSSLASGNTIANLTKNGGNYSCEFEAVSEKSYLQFSVQYDNTEPVVFFNAEVIDLSIDAGVSLNGERLARKSVPLSALETTRLSAFENDLAVGTKYRKRRNLLNPETVKKETIVNTTNGGLDVASGYETTDYIPVKAGDKVYAAAQRRTSSGTLVYRDMIYRYAFFDAVKNFVVGGQNKNYSQIAPFNSVEAPCDGYIVFSYVGNIEAGALAYATTEALSQSAWGDYAFEPYRETDISVTIPDWYGASLMTYGDSITAIGNGESNCVGWQKYVCDYFGIEKHYGRGVGSSTLTYRPATWYANYDGSYHSRDEGGNAPDGKTEHLSSFCTWDRISTMIPAPIKDKIDMIFVMGGTNDFISNQRIGDAPVWNSGNKTDALWMSAEEYNGGDFDITTFAGAVASTIMKLQKRCPNAVIVLGTPISGYGTGKNAEKNGIGLTVEDYANEIRKVAHTMSVPCVDVFGTTGINQLNYEGKITDGTHPYSVEGCKHLARAVIGGLKSVARIIE